MIPHSPTLEIQDELEISPNIFDTIDFAPYRRVRPLPKRRRTSGSGTPTTEHDLHASVASLPIPMDGSVQAAAVALLGANHAATPEQLLTNPELLSTQMTTLQQYYNMPFTMPAMHDLFTRAEALTGENGVELSRAFARNGDYAGGEMGGVSIGDIISAGGGGGGEELEEDINGHGDYVDHLEQPGNTKKRKTPANAHGSARGHDAGSDGDDDSPAESLNPHGAADASTNTSSDAAPRSKPRRLSRAARANLKHKEIFESRKRQLAAVMGALSYGDDLALDEALSASYAAFAAAGIDESPTEAPQLRHPKGRPRFTRAVRALRTALPTLSAPQTVQFPTGEFTFSFPCATSERVVATKQEVARLRDRFEAELQRQAAVTAKAAAQQRAAAASVSKSSARSAKRALREQERSSALRSRAKENHASPQISETTSDPIGATASTGTGKRNKKKKRSALANASNPHHLKNYVPSRLPHSNSVNAVQAAQNLISPPPLRFLSAEIPPPRRGDPQTTRPSDVPQITDPADEWICPFCEYELFYGEEADYRRAVRSRKKILRRRRRARERAAAAASGTKLPTAPADKMEYDDYDDAPFEEGYGPGEPNGLNPGMVFDAYPGTSTSQGLG